MKKTKKQLEQTIDLYYDELSNLNKDRHHSHDEEHHEGGSSDLDSFVSQESSEDSHSCHNHCTVWATSISQVALNHKEE